MFFDDYPRFSQTSRTASSTTRLNLRHEAIIESNRDVLAGARVLDLASHDGRWSFAALKAGAAHVTGVEARPDLVENAHRTFAAYGVPPARYEFIGGDLFEVLNQATFRVDVVLCLGFLYHTVRYGELLRGIRMARPRHCVLDTKVITGDEPLVHLMVDRTARQSNAATDGLTHRGRAVSGRPSVSALRLLLDVYDFDVEEQVDWPALVSRHPGAGRTVNDYRTGHRVTLRCRNRERPHANRAAAARPSGLLRRLRGRLVERV